MKKNTPNTHAPVVVHATGNFVETLGMYSFDELFELHRICLEEMSDRMNPMKPQKRYEFHYNFTSGGWNSEFATSPEEAYELAKKRFPSSASNIIEKSFRILSKSEAEYLESLTW